MSNRELESIQNIAKRLKSINAKIKLVALLEKAHEEFKQSNYKESESSCKEVLKDDPNQFIALRGLGCIYQNQKKYTEALNYYNKALEFSKNKEIEYTFIGTIYYIEENLEEAIKYFNLAIDENDNYDSAYEGRNQAMLEKHLEILDLQDRLIKQKIF